MLRVVGSEKIPSLESQPIIKCVPRISPDIELCLIAHGSVLRPSPEIVAKPLIKQPSPEHQLQSGYLEILALIERLGRAQNRQCRSDPMQVGSGNAGNPKRRNRVPRGALEPERIPFQAHRHPTVWALPRSWNPPRDSGRLVACAVIGCAAKDEVAGRLVAWIGCGATASLGGVAPSSTSSALIRASKSPSLPLQLFLHGLEFLQLPFDTFSLLRVR